MIDGMTKKDHERQEKAVEVASGVGELARRRAELIAEFQAYMHMTSRELSLASDEETDALRTPLLAMKLTEEDIGAWEKFRPLIQKHLHAAQALHVRIGHLLTEATSDHLLDSREIAIWETFFQSSRIGFQEKERGAQELLKHISLRKTQEIVEHPRKAQQEKVVEKDIAPKEQKNEKKPEQSSTQEKNWGENTAQLYAQERTADHPQEEQPSPLHSTRAHAHWLLALLPPTIAPLYRAAVRHGSIVLSALQKTIEQSLVRQSFGIRSRQDAAILTQEKLQSPEESLVVLRASAAQGEEAPTVILQPISLATQSSVVRSIHQPLLDDLLILEQRGMRPPRG